MKAGIATREEMRRIARARQEWAQNPDAFYARPCVELLGWKD